MELIKIIFFSLGSFFGVENTTIIAEKTTVKIDTKTHIINVYQANLFTMIRNEQDSIKASDELFRIGNPASKDKRYDWRSEFETYEWKTSDINSDKKNQQLDVIIKLNYNTKEQLKDFAIDYIEEDDSYALINIDSWNIETITGVLKGNYWYFKDEISFSISPAKTMPDKYKVYIQGLYKYWEKVKP